MPPLGILQRAAKDCGISLTTAFDLLKTNGFLSPDYVDATLRSLKKKEIQKFTVARILINNNVRVKAHFDMENVQLINLIGVLTPRLETLQNSRILSQKRLYQRRICQRLRRQRASKKQELMQLYRTHLYVQIMKSDRHCLSISKSREIKAINRSPSSDLQNVSSQLSFSVTTHSLFYTFKNFHKLPHGSAPNDQQEAIFTDLKEKGIPHFHVEPFNSKDGKFLTDPNVKIYYPHSVELEQLNAHLATVDWEGFLEYVLKHGESDNDSPRDQVPGKSIAKRANFGFGQVQSNSWPRTQTFLGESLPYPLLKFLEGPKAIPDNLRGQLATILSYSQQLLDTSYEEPIMDDKLRTEHMATKLNWEQLGLKESASRFEYVDIYVEHKATLNRHMDYQNDYRPGYNFGASYSKIIDHGGKDYRINFIMTTRSSCGACMDKIRDRIRASR